MVREGYPKSFSGAVTAASSTVGSITPPSIIMLIQAMVMNESVGALFMVGVIPGILVGAVEMVYTHFSSTRNHYPRRTEPASFREFLTAFKRVIVPLGTPLIIVGGITVGVFIPREAAVTAVGYSLFAGVVLLRTLETADILQTLVESGTAAATVLFAISAANVLGWFITAYQIPQKLGEMVLSVSANKVLFLIIVNLLCLMMGLWWTQV